MIRFTPITKATSKPPRKPAKPKRPNIELEDAMLKAADSTTPRASVTIMNSLKKFANGLTQEDITKLLESGALDRDVVNLPWEQLEDMLANDIKPDLVRSVKAGADAANMTTTRTINAALGIEPVLTFDATNRRVAKYIDRKTANLVKQISRESRQTIRDVVKRSLSEPDFDTMEVFRTVKRSVGLDTRRARAVENFRRGLLSQENPPDEKRLNHLVDKFADQQLKQRANTIARTEMMDAANQGQLEGMKQAREMGFTPGATVYKEWMITKDDRTCETCIAMDGVRVPLDAAFTVEIISQSGKSRGVIKVDKPPAHPNCRCVAQNVIEGGL